AFDRAEVMGVIEREVGREAKGPELATLEYSAVRFAHVFEKNDVAPVQFSQQLRRQRVVTQHVRQAHCAGLWCELLNYLVICHGMRAGMDVEVHGLEAAMEDGGTAGIPGDGWKDDLAAAVKPFERSKRQEVGTGAGVDEDAVADAEPPGPFFFKDAHLPRLRQ